jgi:hypothetical protein
MIQMAGEDQFVESPQEILKVINEDRSNGTFQAEVRRVQEVSQGNGDYFR